MESNIGADFGVGADPTATYSGATGKGGGMTNFGNKFMGYMFGTDPRAEQLPAQSQEQQQYQNQTLQQLMQSNPKLFKFLQQFMGDDEESMNEYSAPFMRQFNTKILPGITERFGGAGDSGGSSGLMNAMGEAGTDLQQRLASDRQKMGLDAVGRMQGMNDPAMKDPFGYAKYDASEGLIAGILKALASNLGK